MIDQWQRKLALAVLKNRYWQHLVNEGLKKNAFSVPVHCAFGHEAIAASISEVMESEDQLVLTHRNIAYNLARIGSLAPLWSEYKHLSSGAGGGVLGSMNLANPAYGVVYTSSILGNNMPVGCGLALGNVVLERKGVVIVLTGDGAMEEGTIYESMEMAKYQRLPWLLIIENNHFAMSSTIDERRSPIDIMSLCRALGVTYELLRGNDVFSYVAKLKTIRKAVASGQPAVVEVDLKNLYRHAGPTPGWPTDPMNIDIQRGLVVECSSDDPVHVLKENLPDRIYESLEQEVLAEKWSE